MTDEPTHELPLAAIRISRQVESNVIQMLELTSTGKTGKEALDNLKELITLSKSLKE